MPSKSQNISRGANVSIKRKLAPRTNTPSLRRANTYTEYPKMDVDVEIDENEDDIDVIWVGKSLPSNIKNGSTSNKKIDISFNNFPNASISSSLSKGNFTA